MYGTANKKNLAVKAAKNDTNQVRSKEKTEGKTDCKQAADGAGTNVGLVVCYVAAQRCGSSRPSIYIFHAYFRPTA